MSDFIVIRDLQISHVLKYTPDFQFIETSNSNILFQTLEFMDRHYLVWIRKQCFFRIIQEWDFRSFENKEFTNVNEMCWDVETIFFKTRVTIFLEFSKRHDLYQNIQVRYSVINQFKFEINQRMNLI